MMGQGRGRPACSRNPASSKVIFGDRRSSLPTAGRRGYDDATTGLTKVTSSSWQAPGSATLMRDPAVVHANSAVRDVGAHR